MSGISRWPWREAQRLTQGRIEPPADPPTRSWTSFAAPEFRATSHIRSLVAYRRHPYAHISHHLPPSAIDSSWVNSRMKAAWRFSTPCRCRMSFSHGERRTKAPCSSAFSARIFQSSASGSVELYPALRWGCENEWKGNEGCGMSARSLDFTHSRWARSSRIPSA